MTGPAGQARTSFLLCATLAGILLSGCATYRIHPEFNERHPQIRSAAPLPGAIQSFRVTFMGDKDPLMAGDTLVNWMAVDEISNELKRKGYTVRTVDFSDKALEQHPEVRTAWYNARKMYDKALEDISKRRQRKFTYTLGPVVNELADHADSDVLVFTKGECLHKSGGELAKEIFWNVLAGTAVLPFETRVTLGIVDGNTGDLLWFNRNLNVAVNPTESNQFRGMIREMLRAFPDAPKEKDKKIGPEQQRQGFESGAAGMPTGVSTPLPPVKTGPR